MSEEYFNQSRNSRGGGELFNASGEKLTLLNDFIARTERKAKDREDKKKATNYAVMSVNKLLEEKRLESTRRRLYDSPMSLATKMAIYGDEFHLREELDNGYPLNCRDSVVRLLLAPSYDVYISLRISSILTDHSLTLTPVIDINDDFRLVARCSTKPL